MLALFPGSGYRVFSRVSTLPHGKMQHVGGLESRSIDHGGLGAIAVCVLEGCTPFRGILGEIRTFQKMDPHTTDFPQKVAFWKGNPHISEKSRFVK